MTTASPEPTHAPSPQSPDVDLRDGMRAMRQWWWLVVLGIALGVAVSLVRGTTQATRYEAHTTVYVGQPVSPNGVLLPTISAKAATAIETARSDGAIQAAAKAAGVTPARIRGEIVATAVASPLASKLQAPPPIVKISVRDAKARVANDAAQAIGAYLVSGTNTYVTDKVAHLKQVITDADASLEELANEQKQAVHAAQNGGADAATYSVLLSALAREGSLTRQDAENARASLGLANEIETSRVVNTPHAVKLTASSGSRGLLFGAFLGLLLGLGAAWIANTLTSSRR